MEVDMKCRSNSESDVCLVCCNAIDYETRYNTIGVCNHKGCCSLCALRMRYILKKNNCMICQNSLETVICIENSSDRFENFESWGDSIGPSHTYDEASRMFFPKSYYPKVMFLRSFQCHVCSVVLNNLDSLKNHLKANHSRKFCDLCLEKKEHFLQEHSVYTTEELAYHVKKGTPKTGFVGHPGCDFCKNRFYSNIELFAHLNMKHYECDLCEKLHNIQHRYYKDYNDLENHFRKEHFLCEQADCLAKKFVVFNTQLDFKKHCFKQHPELKIQKQLEVNFNIRRVNRHAANGRLYEDPPAQVDPPISQDCNTPSITVADFPSLSAATSSMPDMHLWANQVLRAPKTDDFPRLGGSSEPAVNISTSTTFRDVLAPAASLAKYRGGDQWVYDTSQLPFGKQKKTKQKKKKKPSTNTSSDTTIANVFSKIQQTLGDTVTFLKVKEVVKDLNEEKLSSLEFYISISSLFSSMDFQELFDSLLLLINDEAVRNHVREIHVEEKPAEAIAPSVNSVDTAYTKVKNKSKAKVKKKENETSTNTVAVGWAAAFAKSGIGKEVTPTFAPRTTASSVFGPPLLPDEWYTANTSSRVASSAASPRIPPTSTQSTRNFLYSPEIRNKADFPDLPPTRNSAFSKFSQEVDAPEPLWGAPTPVVNPSAANVTPAEESSTKVDLPSPYVPPSISNKEDFPELPKPQGKTIGIQPASRFDWNRNKTKTKKQTTKQNINSMAMKFSSIL